MIAEIILIPDGMGLDAAKASAQYVARGLSSIGVKVREHIAVCPDSKQFQQAVSSALSRSNVLVTLGGMGRESNFLAKTVLSRGLGLPLQENPDAMYGMREYCRKTGERFDAADSALAMLPRGAAAFAGSYSKLPGCAISSAKQHIIMLPETIAEIAPMFNKYVSPYLGGTSTTTVTRTLRTYGVKESAVNDALGNILNFANPAVTVHKEDNEVIVRVAAHAATSQKAAALCTPVLQDIVDLLGDFAYGLDVDSMQAAVIDKLEKKELDLAIAEGGTSGMLTRVFTETPGGQDILRYTVSVDTPAAKEQRLGVKQKLLKKHGNVSEYAAVAVASAAREKANTVLGVAVLANTGGEKSRTCPIGTVFIAVCDADNVFVKKLVVGDGDTDEDIIVDAALSRALNMVRLVADYHPHAYTAAIPLDEALDGRTVTDLDDYEEAVTEDDEDKTTFWSRFFDNFIVHKSDKRGVRVRKFIFILAMLIFLGSGGYVAYHYLNGYIAKQQAEDLQNMFSFGDMSDVKVSEDYPKNYSLKFAGLWNVNPDVVAFISIPETGVKYPIVQSKDNDYYLRRNFYGKSNKYGVPFMDYRVDVKKPSDNVVIYGHNMMDGQIFGELTGYRKLDYYKKHPTIDFTTVYHENRYKIISVFITNAYENQGPVFAYHDFIDAENSNDFLHYVGEVKKRSLINTAVDVKKSDELLTLSTCTYEFKDARLVIVARAVRKGETDEVDTESAVLNPSPLMPDVWYKIFGGSKPVGESVTEVVTAPVVNSQPSSEILQSVAPLSSTSSVAESHVSVISSEVSSVEKPKPSVESKEEVSQVKEESSSQTSEDSAILDGDSSLAMVSQPALQEIGEDILPAVSKTKTTKKTSLSDAVVTVNAGGRVMRNADELDIISRVVQNEVGSSFSVEAIKAQAVAAYTFVTHANNTGSTPYVALAKKADAKVVKAVKEVLGEAIYYDGEIAFTPYHATSSGMTTSSAAVWGGTKPYLVAVDSSVDKKAPKFKVHVAMSRQKVESLISQKLGITATDDPSTWFEVLSHVDGDYNGEMSVCGETQSQKTGSTITGRMLRESVFGLRSAKFDVLYRPESDSFVFTTYGYGHGVGMSQNGANLYAKKGWTYKEILEHYYPGTEIK